MKLRVMTVAVLALVGSVLSVPQTSGDSAADQVTVSADFVGIQSDVEGVEGVADRAVVTWYGKPGGEIGVLWASSVDLDIRLFEDAPETLIPEFVGKLSEADIDAVKERLKELGASSRDIMSPASAQGVPGPICSLNIHNPYWSFGLDEAVGWSHQVCSNMLDHFVESKIRQQRWWNSYRTIGHETSGWGSSSYLQAIATGTCNSSAEKRWKNWGNGDATGLDGTHYNGPSASTNAFKLGCKH